MDNKFQRMKLKIILFYKMYLLWGKPAQYGGIGRLDQNPTADEQCPIFIISPLSSFPIFILLPSRISLIVIFENRGEEECDVQLHLSARGGGCHHQRSEQVQMSTINYHRIQHRYITPSTSFSTPSSLSLSPLTPWSSSSSSLIIHLRNNFHH